MRTIIEPFRIRTVEPLNVSSRGERAAALKAAHYNLFGLRSRDVMIDLLTDSGTGAMSTRQWAAMMAGDESYAGSESFYELQAAVRELTGYRHVFPVHQGRAAERIVCQLLGGPGKVVPNNTHIDTTRANLEFTGATAVDLPIRNAHDPTSDAPFKGDMDVQALAALLADSAPGGVPFGMLTVTNNAVGGQPVSLANVRATAAAYGAHGVPFLLDAARFAENAWFIQQREPGQAHRSLREIALDVFACADGCLISAKKDGLVNTGGVLALDDDDLAAQIRNLLILSEGFPTYGGLAGRDMAALAQGLREVLDPDYLRYRHASALYLADALDRVGVPTVRPTGMHAVYVDARAYLDHLWPQELPGHALCCELYLTGGVRAAEVGTLMFGGTDGNGDAIPAALDLVRLTLPRRVYTQSHIDWVVETFAEITPRRHELPAYRIVEQPPFLRAFTARLEPHARQAGTPAVC